MQSISLTQRKPWYCKKHEQKCSTKSHDRANNNYSCINEMYFKIMFLLKENLKVQGDIRSERSGKFTSSGNLFQHLEHMQVPKRTSQVSGRVRVPY